MSVQNDLNVCWSVILKASVLFKIIIKDSGLFKIIIKDSGLFKIILKVSGVFGMTLKFSGVFKIILSLIKKKKNIQKVCKDYSFFFRSQNFLFISVKLWKFVRFYTRLKFSFSIFSFRNSFLFFFGGGGFYNFTQIMMKETFYPTLVLKGRPTFRSMLGRVWKVF